MHQARCGKDYTGHPDPSWVSKEVKVYAKSVEIY
jgi:hypothetical protein